MVKITNGEQTLIVSRGAFRELYLPSGWLEVGNTPFITPQELPKAPMGNGDGKPTTDPEELSVAHSEEDAINGMSEMELKQYASLLGIKTKNLKTREDLLAAIRSH